ncbi:hypothetical protein NGM36_05145 [Streptomyces mutabilis]|uniref:hypothetical protein n=1 Tax=Streptomyces mutabilis TaxID=67332 RepID=UPI0022BA4021|nr:hypothetical protein [Streptomyces mutabilis]MCZ9349184.1 hypothetical protein [Streptomyces mutabilis]
MTSATSSADLPEGWRLDGEQLVHEAELHGWKVTVVTLLNAPWDGPASIRIDPPDDPQARVVTDGITAELMRSMPLAEIRRTARELRARLGRVTGEDAAGVVLDRVETEREYAFDGP